MSNRLLDYYNLHYKAIVDNYNEASLSFGVEALHDMRVAIKRIRSVNLLLTRLHGSEMTAKCQCSSIREIFRLAGKIRDLQVQLQLVTDTSSKLGITFFAYLRYLRKQEFKATRKMRIHRQNGDISGNLTKYYECSIVLINALNNQQISDEMFSLVADLFELVSSMRGQQTQDENFHEIRRRLKQCQYLLTVIDHSESKLPHVASTLKKLNKLNTLLGDWHDKHVAMEMLETFMKDKLLHSDPGKERYQFLLESIRKNRNCLVRSILKQLDVCCNQLSVH